MCSLWSIKKMKIVAWTNEIAKIVNASVDVFFCFLIKSDDSSLHSC